MHRMDYKKCIVPFKIIKVTLTSDRSKTFCQIHNIAIRVRLKADKLLFETLFCPAIANAWEIVRIDL